jgi:hypothetical protein
LLADYLGNPDFKIPGEVQRIKQAREIQSMLRGENTPIDNLVDDHSIHISYLRNYMADGPGLELKRTKPMIYGLLSQHLQQHLQAVAKAQQGQQQPPPGGPKRQIVGQPGGAKPPNGAPQLGA